MYRGRRRVSLGRGDLILYACGIEERGIRSQRPRSLIREHHQPRVQYDLKDVTVSTQVSNRRIAPSTYREQNMAGTDEAMRTRTRVSRLFAGYSGTKGTYTSGKMTAQPSEPIRHSTGRSGVETTTTPAMMTNERRSGNQKRFAILGISLKKLDRSTSFFVAPQVMLYENRCARMAWLSGIERPPKKKKLQGRTGQPGQMLYHKEGRTYKNGIHFRFWSTAHSRSRSPRRYSSSVNPRLPEP